MTGRIDAATLKAWLSDGGEIALLDVREHGQHGEGHPFFAVPLCAGITGTMGGVLIDANAQAQTPAGAPFPGLYAVGTPVAGLEGGPRAGYVGGLSKAFVLGLLAAEHIAAH